MIFAQLIKSALIAAIADKTICNLMTDKFCVSSYMMWAFASAESEDLCQRWASFLLSVSNVHMQIGHNRKDITPKWHQDFATRFSNSFRGFQVTQAQQHF